MLTAETYAVVGASRHPEKFGFLILRTLKAANKTVYAINPNTNKIDGEPCFGSLSALPCIPDVAVMVVPPNITEAAVTECVRLGIKNIWMQPGAESAAAVAACRKNGIAVVAGGPCIMVLLRTQGYLPRIHTS